VESSRLPFDVSRETLERLHVFAALAQKWTRRINLVSRNDAAHLWQRHIIDSAQIWPLRPEGIGHWVDLGAGGGFPGMVLAIIGSGDADPPRFTLIESDMRKAAFLVTAARETGCPVTVIAERIENAPPQRADVVSARALAPLDTLLGWAERHVTTEGTCIFPKGRSWRTELSEAAENWRLDHEIIPSITNRDSVVLKIKGFSRV